MHNYIVHQARTVPGGLSPAHRRWVVRYESPACDEFYLHEEVWARSEAEARQKFAALPKHRPVKRVLGIRQLDRSITGSKTPFVWLLSKKDLPPL